MLLRMSSSTVMILNNNAFLFSLNKTEQLLEKDMMDFLLLLCYTAMVHLALNQARMLSKKNLLKLWTQW